MSTIEEVNTTMAQSLKLYNKDTYFSIIHSKFYKDINMSCHESLDDRYHYNGLYCVDYTKLVEFDVTDKDNEDIVYNLHKLELIEGKDYKKYNNNSYFYYEEVCPRSQFTTWEEYENFMSKSPQPQAYYMLTKQAFKSCLLKKTRSLDGTSQERSAAHNQKYIDYCLTIEKLHSHYLDYTKKYYANQ